MNESCHGLGKALPLKSSQLARWVCAALAESGLRDALLRLSFHWDKRGNSAFCVIIRKFKSHPREIYEKGVSLMTSVMRRPLLRADNSQIKCSQYVGGVLAHLDRGERKTHEIIFLDQNGFVADGSVSNIFLINDKRLLTPPVSSGILRGVTREQVMHLAAALGIKTQEMSVTRHTIYSSEECFMTNTSSEVLPVTEVDGRVIGDGLPGPVTRKLAAAFKRKTKES